MGGRNGSNRVVFNNTLTRALNIPLVVPTEITNLSGSTLTLSGILSGSNSLTKSGAGSLTLTGTNTYSGGTSVLIGTITLTGTGVLAGNSSISISSGAAFSCSSTGSQSFGPLTGSGTFQQAASGTKNFLNNNTSFAGNFNLTGGLNLFGSGSGSALAAFATGSAGVGELVLQTGTYTFDIGSLQGSGNVRTQTAGSGGAVTVSIGARNQSSTYSGIFSQNTSSLGVSKVGSGTLTLSGASTHSGASSVVTGTMKLVDVGNGVWASSIAVSSGAILELNSSSLTADFVVFKTGVTFSGAGTINKTGAGYVGLKGTISMTGQINVQAGTLGNGAVTAVWTSNTASMDISAGAAFDLRGESIIINALTGAGTIGNSFSSGTDVIQMGVSNGSGSFTGIIQNTGPSPYGGTAVSHVTKSGSGTQTLTGANTYTGATIINGGILSVATIGNGGVASGNMGSATNAASNLVLGGGTLQYIGVTASTDRNFTLTAATASTIDVTSGAATLTISGASTATSGGLTKAGSGALSLSGANLFTGAISVTGGSLTLSAHAGATNSGLNVASGTTFSLTGGNLLNTGTTTGSGAIIKNAAGYIEFSGNATAFSGTVSSTAGQTYVDGPNGGSSLAAYTTGAGGTAGEIILYNDVAHGSGTYTVSMGSLSGSSNVRGTLASDTQAGTVTLSVGALNTSTTFAGVLKEQTGGTPVSLALTKVGTGTFTITNTNTLTGTTSITSGALGGTGNSASSAHALTGTGHIFAGSTGTNGVYTCGALSFTSTAQALDVYSSGVANLSSKITSGTITAASGFTVNLLDVMAVGTYTLIGNIGTLPSTLPTIGTNNSGRTPTFIWTIATGLQVILT